MEGHLAKDCITQALTFCYGGPHVDLSGWEKQLLFGMLPEES